MKLSVIFAICMSCVVAEPGLFSSTSDSLGQKTLLGTGIRHHFINKSEQDQRNFTWEEVAQYDGKNDAPLYVVIDGMVYDVTEFTQYHPAGPNVLKKYGGKDATAAFYASGMTAEVISNILPLFQVGKIVDPAAE